MKIGIKEIEVKPEGREQVVITFRYMGAAIGTEFVSPDQARQLARELAAAADQAEGRPA